MAQKVSIVLIDDLSGVPSDDIETVEFSVNKASYKIDLNAENREKFTQALMPFIEAAEVVKRAPKRSASGNSARREELQKVRAWAQAHGIEVSDRGRISRGVMDQYKEFMEAQVKAQ